MLAKPMLDNGRFVFRAATALIVLLFGLFLLMLTVSIMREQEAAQRRAEERVVAASQVVATNARWISELSRQALGRIDDALGPDIEQNAAATAGLIRDAVENLPGNVKSYVVAADGRTLFSTDPDVKPLDIRDRPYFSTLAEGRRWYVSSLMVSRLDGTQIFVFSKRLERAGKFVGAAIISFDVELLKEVWESVEFDSISTVSLVREDGQLVARYPLAEGTLDLSGYVLFTDYLKQADSGTYPTVSPADGVRRIVGYRRVPGTPFVALASVSTDSAFELFRRNTWLTLAFALPTAAALAAAVIWILRLLRKDQERRQQLAEALDLNRMLVRDTHHRVKNNLQAIMSMIRMHGLPDELKTDLQSRIAAMSAVHEHLYRLDQFTEVKAETLIPSIAEALRAGFPKPVTVEYDIDPLVLDRDHAMPLALLVNEVVTNSMKYAFPEEPGTIRVSLKRQESGEVKLTVADDGIGFDPDKPSSGLGTRLIRAMVVQLGATSSYNFGEGTRFEAVLPAKAIHNPAPAAAPVLGTLQPA